MKKHSDISHLIVFFRRPFPYLENTTRARFALTLHKKWSFPLRISFFNVSLFLTERVLSAAFHFSSCIICFISRKINLALTVTLLVMMQLGGNLTKVFIIDIIYNILYYRLHEKISAIWLAERSTILAVFVLWFQYLYSLTK